MIRMTTGIIFIKKISIKYLERGKLQLTEAIFKTRIRRMWTRIRRIRRTWRIRQIRRIQQIRRTRRIRQIQRIWWIRILIRI